MNVTFTFSICSPCESKAKKKMSGYACIYSSIGSFIPFFRSGRQTATFEKIHTAQKSDRKWFRNRIRKWLFRQRVFRLFLHVRLTKKKFLGLNFDIKKSSFFRSSYSSASSDTDVEDETLKAIRVSQVIVDLRQITLPNILVVPML